MQSILPTRSTEPFLAQQASNSIEAAAAQCRGSLQQCTAIPILMQLEWAENRLAEFKLWAATTGALAGGAASLDARLTTELDTKNLVKGLLVLLSECIGKCKGFALPSGEQTEVVEETDEIDSAPEDDDEWWAGDSQEIDPRRSHDAAKDIPRGFSPWSDDSRSHSESDSQSMAQEVSPLVEAKAEVEQIINHLTRVALAIRKSGTTSRLHKADRSFDPDNHGKLRRHLELIVLARGRQDGSSNYHIDREALTTIQERLILANLRRRNRYTYAQKHAEKLAFDSTSSNDKGEKSAENPLVLRQNDPAVTAPASARMTESMSLQIPSQGRGISPKQNVVLTATSASRVAQTIDAVPERIPTPSRVAKTNITATAAKILYPKPPKSKTLRYFQCPCCSQTLPDLYRETTLWKKHLMADICPYTCILDECPTPERLYVTRHEWTRHIEKQHRQCWQCPACSVPGKPPVIFPSVDIFLHHLREIHSESIYEEQYSTIIIEAARPVPPGICRCPLCESSGPADSPALLDHIAEHLHEFSLRSLPWPKDGPKVADVNESRDTADNYFDTENYFDQESENNSLQDMPIDSDRDSDGLASLSTHSSRTDFIPNPRNDYTDYTVAWICALFLEMAAAIAMLDERHAQLRQHTEDTNCYVLGRIKGHNVVIASLPEGEFGMNNAANVMANLNRSFPKIRACLMVGIGGGAPYHADIRLGDVVVGSRVMQHDLGKVIQHGDLQRTAIVKTPPFLLHTAVTVLRAKHNRSKSSIPAILKEKFGDNSDYGRPNLPDQLFSSAYDHISPAPNCRECESCDQSRLVPRSIRKTDDPHIHYGAIASGNQVMRSASQRDSIARELDVMCFEMEAAGLMGNFPCLPIRGICDYADSHKSKTWQKYAAATAAAYATELLAVLPGAHSHPESNHLPDDGHSSSKDHRQQLLESLKFDQLDSRQTSIKAAHNRTCRWFLKSPDYNEWLKPEMLAEHHGLLWIRGKPGAGKSTLMKYLYTNTSRTRGRQTLIACFFFHARGDQLERSLEGMHRSLLLQLLRGHPELQSVLDDLVVEDEGGCPSLDTLKDMFRKAVLRLGRRQFTCFIDAVDECEEQQVMDMVDYFEDLTAEATDAGIELRICFSSRHYPYVQTEKGIKLTLEDQQGHTEDLANYVASRLRIHNRDLKEELQSKLIEKASGVFLWVVLVVDVLNKEYARGGTALKKRLAEMPSGFHNLFEDMLRRDSTDREQLLLCVLWILCAKRPLRPEEFRHAMWSDPSLKGLIDEELPEVSTSDAGDSTEVFVIGTSKGLAEITKTNRPTVQFIHESVRDFLLKGGGLQSLWPGLGFDWNIPSHEKLKTCCHAYLNHPLVLEPAKQLISEGPRSTADIPAKFPFLEYANQHMLDHADIAAVGITQSGFLSGLSMPDWTHVANHFEKYNSQKYTPNANILYILADRGYSELIRNWLQNHPPDIVLPTERYERPLFAALAHGHRYSVASLLGLDSKILRGADFTDGLSLSKDLGEYAKRTPLTWAAQEGRLGMTKILLQSGANVSQIDDNGRTAISRACEHGQKEIVELLLQNGADVNAQGSIGTSPLTYASRNGHKEIARLLLENGATIN